MKTLLRKFVRDEEGAELVEHAVMAALIFAGLIAAISFLSSVISAAFNTVTNTISTGS